MKRLALMLFVGIAIGWSVSLVPTDYPAVQHAPRSSGWYKARAEHLLQHPVCRVCGKSTQLEVHHIQPFAKRPDLELDPSNLVTLCANPSCKSHLTIGHLGDYDLSNPDVMQDADLLNTRRRKAREQ